MSDQHEGPEPTNPYAVPSGGATPAPRGGDDGIPTYPDRGAGQPQGQGGYPTYPQGDAVAQGGYPTYPQGGHPGDPYPSHGQGHLGELAGWGSRVGAHLLDGLLVLLPLLAWMAGMVIMVVGLPRDVYDDTTGVTHSYAGNGTLATVGALLMLVGVVLTLGLTLWNRTFRQGRTGQSWGKKVMGLHLLDERTGQPIGAGMSFVRELAHNVDSLPLDLGYLWPLWDSRKQTFADKLCHTVVVRRPRV